MWHLILIRDYRTYTKQTPVVLIRMTSHDRVRLASGRLGVRISAATDLNHDQQRS